MYALFVISQVKRVNYDGLKKDAMLSLYQTLVKVIVSQFFKQKSAALFERRILF